MNLRLSARLFFLFFVALNLFFALRITPSSLADPQIHPDIPSAIDRTIERVYDQAEQNAQQPFGKVKDRFLYLSRNPALFQAVSEMFIRAGLGLYGNLIFCILLVNIGVIFQFLWVRRLFASEVVAHFSLLYSVSTPLLLFQGPTIHHFPYVFCFFNITVWAYLRYLSSRERRFLVLAALAYFGLCHNYWMFYVSTAIIILGLTKANDGRFFTKPLLVLYAMPVLAVFGHAYRVAFAYGGLAQGIKRLGDIFVARTMDKRLEDSHWYPNQRFVSDEDWGNFLKIIDQRIDTMFLVPGSAYLAALGIAIWLAGREGRKRYQPFLYLIPAALAWNVLFFQHTVIHTRSATYGYFAWMLVFALCVHQFWLVAVAKHSTRVELSKRVLAAVCLAVIAVKFARSGFWELYVGYLNF